LSKLVNGDRIAWYVGRALRGRADNRRLFSRPLVGLAAMAAIALGLAACGGGGERQDAAAADGTYEVRIIDAKLKPIQQLAQRQTMELSLENTGDEDIPDLTVTVKVLGREGEESRDAFAYRDPQKNLNRHDRPIWIVTPGYPTLKSDPVLGDATTASARTFAFGPLPAGERADVIWELTPVKVGSYRLSYEVSPNIYGTGTITEEGGGAPAGRLPVRIRQAPQQLRVNERGRVVEIKPDSP
jgi:hypothetical protein